MRNLVILLSFLSVGLAGCSMHYLLADTTSDKVVAYENDYYVAYSQDSILEFHYDLWSVDATMWLSILNRSESLVVLRPDLCLLKYQGEEIPFDQYADWEEYVTPLLGDSVLQALDPDKFLPIRPGTWKGLLGPPLKIRVSRWKDMEEGRAFSRDDTPVLLETRLCYVSTLWPDETRCETHAIWVEHLQFFRGRDFRRLEEAPDFETSDKFFLFNMPGAGTASLLTALIPILLIL